MTMRPVRPFRAAIHAVLALAAASALGACNSKLEVPPPRPIGLLQIDANGDVSTTSVHPTATFIRAYGLNIADTRNPGDTCEVIPFSESTEPPGAIAGVSAGDALVLDLSGTTTQLVPTSETAGKVYAPAASANVTYHPGDTATVRIPGAPGGFPATTFALRTAESVAFDSVLVPSASSTADLPVKWTAGENTSTMLLSLRYQVPTEAGLKQLLCIMTDDGDFTIPANRLAGWRAANTVGRSAVATRVRTVGVALEGATFFGTSSMRRTVALTAQQP